MPKATFHIRKADAKDITDSNGKPKYGVPYFLKNTQEKFDQNVYFFTDATNKADFREWFRNGQVYVVNRFCDEVVVEYDKQQVIN